MLLSSRKHSSSASGSEQSGKHKRVTVSEMGYNKKSVCFLKKDLRLKMETDSGAQWSPIIGHLLPIPCLQLCHRRFFSLASPPLGRSAMETTGFQLIAHSGCSRKHLFLSRLMSTSNNSIWQGKKKKERWVNPVHQGLMMERFKFFFFLIRACGSP